MYLKHLLVLTLFYMSFRGIYNLLTLSMSFLARLTTITWIDLQLSCGYGRVRLAIDSNGFFIATSTDFIKDKIGLYSVSRSAGSDINVKRSFYSPEMEPECFCNDIGPSFSDRSCVKGICFIPKESKENNPVLALLREFFPKPPEILVIEWDPKEDSFHVLYKYSVPGPITYAIVPVPEFVGYAFLFMKGEILLVNFLDAGIRTVGRIIFDIRHTPNRMVCSWCWGRQDMTKAMLIFSTFDGEGVYKIEIDLESDGDKMKLSDCLFKCGQTRNLLWVEGDFLAVFFYAGDGKILKLEEERVLYQSLIQDSPRIIDMSVVDHHDEKREEMFAVHGRSPRGSLSIIRSGISVDTLLKTDPVYQGITGIWAVTMKPSDLYDSILVIAFLEATRVLSVGLKFHDVTELVGFLPEICTLACGCVSDGLLVQIHELGVRLCMRTSLENPEGSSSAICTSWSPPSSSLIVGAVGEEIIVVATSTRRVFVLGVKNYEVYQIKNVELEYELSCVSIPPKFHEHITNSLNKSADNTHVVFVIGTRKPSVEVLWVDQNKNVKVLAIGIILRTSSTTSSFSDCIPHDVRLVRLDQDRLYVLVGLRNGILVRYEWPLSEFNYTEKSKEDSPTNLQLIADCKFGNTPASLVPLNNSLDTDIIILSDRPWLLQTASQNISVTSISFQPSTHVTLVRSTECPKRIVFVAESRLHLVEMMRNKRLSEQRHHLEGTPWRVLYHRESRLVVIMRIDLGHAQYSSDVCCIDPLSGSVVSSLKLEPGELGICMELIKIGNEHVLVVGTKRPVRPSRGACLSVEGRLLVLCLEHPQNSDSGCSKAGSSSCSSPFHEADGSKLEDNEAWRLRLAFFECWDGPVNVVCPFLDNYFVASVGHSFYVCSFLNASLRFTQLASQKTNNHIMDLSTHSTRIAVGSLNRFYGTGILVYSYNEDTKTLEEIYRDPVEKQSADCILIDVDTAVVSCNGTIAVYSPSNDLKEINARNPRMPTLSSSCSYFLGNTIRIKRGSFSCKLISDGVLSPITDLSEKSIMASTDDGSLVSFIPLTREEYVLLEEVQAKVSKHPLTSPILGDDHKEFRSRENPDLWATVPAVPMILDGDMLAQFLELTTTQQEVLLGSHNNTIEDVCLLLERILYGLLSFKGLS